MDGAIMGRHRKSRDRKKAALTILIMVWIVALAFYVVLKVM
jgi:hypothetical protein